MKKVLGAILVCLLAPAMCGGCSNGGNSEAAALGTEFVQHMTAGEYQAAYDMMDADMQTAMPLDSFESFWSEVESQLGAFVSLGDAFTEESGEYQIVYVNASFEGQDISFQVSLDGEGLVAGLYLQQPYVEE